MYKCKSNHKHLDLVLPKPLKTAIKNGCVVSIIQFGSSIYKKQFNDIDLAIVIKDDSYQRFVQCISKNKLTFFDISLIKECEVRGPKKFKFGNHGAHFLYSLINGRLIYGVNPFKQFEKYINKNMISCFFL